MQVEVGDVVLLIDVGFGEGVQVFYVVVVSVVVQNGDYVEVIFYLGEGFFDCVVFEQVDGDCEVVLFFGRDEFVCFIEFFGVDVEQCYVGFVVCKMYG